MLLHFLLVLCSIQWRFHTLNVVYSTLLLNVVADIYSDFPRTSDKVGWMNYLAFYEANLWNCKVALKCNHWTPRCDLCLSSTSCAISGIVHVRTKACGKLHAEITCWILILWNRGLFKLLNQTKRNINIHACLGETKIFFPVKPSHLNMEVHLKKKYSINSNLKSILTSCIQDRLSHISDFLLSELQGCILQFRV